MCDMVIYLRNTFLYSVLVIECSVRASTAMLYRTVQQQYICMIPYCNMMIWNPLGIVREFFNNFEKHLIHCHFYVYQDRFTLALIVK